MTREVSPLKLTFADYIIITAILLLGAALRVDSAAADVRFHSDEALYSTYARTAAVYGHWMLDGPLDKPPLSIYANAIGMHLFAARFTPQGVIDVPIRTGELAAKLPNLFAGMIAIVLTGVLARRLYPTRGRTISLVAMLLAALSPYYVAYSASAFTDMLMLTFMLAAVAAAVRDLWGFSGLLLALSVSAKPQGILYLPLIAGIWLLSPGRQINGIFRFGLTFAGGLLALLIWDAARPETSVFTLGSINISQGRLVMPPDTWLPRLETWLNHADGLLGPAWLTPALVAYGVIPALFRRRPVDLALVVTAGGLFFLHWIGAFHTFDRYLLVLVPLLIVLTARTVYSSWTQLPPRLQHPVLASLLIIAAVTAGISAEHDPRADVFRPTSPDGYSRLADWLNAKPLGTIVYDRWLGWEMGYYRGAWSDKRWVYYPDAPGLADDALLNPDPAPRYFVAPDDPTRDVQPWLDALRLRGFTVTLTYDQDALHAYEIIPPWATYR
ncbi:MAG: ArnT family glycosyltransferase [Chloroflexota bacterium]